VSNFSKTSAKRIIPCYEFRGIEIRVYRGRNGRFSAQFTQGNRPVRVEKATEHAAVETAKNKIRELSNPEIQIVRAEKSSAELLLDPTGISLIEAARIIVTAVEKLRPFGVGIPAAVDYYLSGHQGKAITVADLVEELIALKTRDAGIHHARDLTSKLKNGFCQKFGSRLMASIIASELSIYIDSYPGSKRTRRNQHSALVTLFEFAKEHGYLPRGLPTAMDLVKKPKADKPRINILTPDELEGLIEGALAIFSPAVAALLVQTQTGVRSEELRQTDPKKDRARWSDVWLDQAVPEIHIRPEVSKTGEERFSPIAPALAQWLRLLRGSGNAPIFVGHNLYGAYRQIVKKSGVAWRRNGPRKSFNTYDAALTGSFRTTAKAAGNSASTIQRYYHRPTSQVGLVAKQWFSIEPKQFQAAVRKYVAHFKRQKSNSTNP
jgi:integrase